MFCSSRVMCMIIVHSSANWFGKSARSGDIGCFVYNTVAFPCTATVLAPLAV